MLKALEKEPANRFQTALEMAQAIKLALQNPERENTFRADIPLIQPETAKKRTSPARRRWIWGSTLVVITGVLVLIGLTPGTITLYHKKIVNTTRAPYLLGETEQDAMCLARQAGLCPKSSAKAAPNRQARSSCNRTILTIACAGAR